VSKNLDIPSSGWPGKSALSRVLAIDSLIRDNRYPNAEKIAKDFEVSVRTVYGDKKYMCEQLGAPIQWDAKHGGWYYEGGPGSFFLPAVFMTEGDMLAVFIGIEVAERYIGTPYESMLKRSLDKITRLFPETISIQLDQFASFATPHSLIVDEEKLIQLYTASRHYYPVRMTYYSASSGKVSSRQVDPYHLRHFNGEWYIIGMDETRKEVRTFNVGRIRELDVRTDQRFQPLPGFKAEQWFKNSFGIETTDKTHKVRIRFDAAQACYIRERTWHPEQVIEEQEDGSLILKFQAGGLGEVLRWVMQYGSHAEVLQPAVLQKMVRDEVVRMQQLYAPESISARGKK